MASTEITRLLQLSAEERAEIAFALWESLPDDGEGEAPAVTEELRGELDRRVEAHRVNPEAVVPWEVVLARLRGER